MKKKVPLHIRNSVEYFGSETTPRGCAFGFLVVCISAVILGAGIWLLLNWALGFFRHTPV